MRYASPACGGGVQTMGTAEVTQSSMEGLVGAAPNSQFEALGWSNTILTSPDGLTWTQRSWGTSHVSYKLI